MQLNNPFLSTTFKNIWLKHFAKNSKIFESNDTNISLIKSNFNLYAYNVGKNTTNGYSYFFNQSDVLINNNPILLYDIPAYLNSINVVDTKLSILKSKQYSGVLTKLSNFKNLEDLLQKNFKAKKRAELKKFKRRLEHCYDIKYMFYDTIIDKNTYKKLIKSFYNLLEKRYAQKGISNRNLTPKFKAYYAELIFKMINDNKALFFVIKANNKPIAMSLSFLSDDTLFYAIPVFDTDFSKFNLGHVSIMALFEWCYKNNINTFDFSKGDGAYKDKWITDNYFFENHIIFDSNYLTSKLKAYLLKYYFDFKQYLRNQNINSKIQKIKFSSKEKINNKQWKNIDANNYDLKDFTFFNNNKITEFNYALNEFLYKHSLKYEDTSIYKHQNISNIYLIKNNNINQIIKIED